jgi:peptide/nickel transport system ATP-binding protein
MTTKKILEVHDLAVYYKTVHGEVKATDGVSFDVPEKTVFGIAGESGCGKSTLVEGILKLVRPPGYIPRGKVIFDGIDLLNISEKELDKIRWTKLSYIPQSSMNVLNPIITIGEQMTDAVLDHDIMNKKDAIKLADEMLKEVNLPLYIQKTHAHELSGGMKQRVIIAMAISLNPTLIIADEPTTALDVVVQREILQLLMELKEKREVTIVMVSHDLAAHAQIADEMIIMYAGKVVEIGSVYDIFSNPMHPYSIGLLAAIPSLKKKYIKGIPGMAPSPLDWPEGCRFHPRCPSVMPICSKVEPAMKEVESGRCAACHLFGEKE